VIRGDGGKIVVGSHTSVQDNATLHSDPGTAMLNLRSLLMIIAEFPLEIGNYCTIGHNAVVHGCKIEDYCIVGMNR
jgi:carbonic anhydrase/acetyltransferase-like protein (isoleucine patch superfamily)